MAISNFYTECVKFERKQVPAPSGGGQINAWSEGDKIMAGVATKAASENMFAGQLADTQYYAVYVDRETKLEKDDYFRIEWNGRYVRVASLDREPPAMSSINTRLMYGEYVDRLPD